jgi:small subunit ribosomal protein S21
MPVKFDKFNKPVESKNNNGGEFDYIEPIQAQPLEVRVYGNNFEKALRAFRALVQKERVLSTYKEKRSYEKPSDKKRRKRNEARRKMMETTGNRGERSLKKSPRKNYKKSNTPPTDVE